VILGGSTLIVFLEGTINDTENIASNGRLIYGEWNKEVAALFEMGLLS